MNTNSPHVIYGLFDPETKELRYIGYTSNMKRRHYDHHQKYFLKGNSHKNNWIKSLLARGLEAEIFVLERYETAEELPLAEIENIEYYRFLGVDLTNSTNGGDGLSKGYKFSEEARQKMSETHKGHSVSSETRQKIS